MRRAARSLLYPTARNGTHPIRIQEFFGETICVNGKASPFLEVSEPTAAGYRPYLLLAPGERFDIILNFAGHQGANFAMLNDAPAPYKRGGEAVPASSLPDTLTPMPLPNFNDAVRERVLALTEMDRPSDGYTVIGLLG